MRVRAVATSALEPKSLKTSKLPGCEKHQGHCAYWHRKTHCKCKDSGGRVCHTRPDPCSKHMREACAMRPVERDVATQAYTMRMTPLKTAKRRKRATHDRWTEGHEPGNPQGRKNADVHLPETFLPQLWLNQGVHQQGRGGGHAKTCGRLTVLEVFGQGQAELQGNLGETMRSQGRVRSSLATRCRMRTPYGTRSSVIAKENPKTTREQRSKRHVRETASNDSSQPRSVSYIRPYLEIHGRCDTSDCAYPRCDDAGNAKAMAAPTGFVLIGATSSKICVSTPISALSGAARPNQQEYDAAPLLGHCWQTLHRATI